MQKDEIYKRILWNNPLPLLKKKLRGKEKKITIFHQRKHWTQYFEGILKTDPRFIFRRSRDAEAGYKEASNFSVHDPETMDIVIGGRGRFLTTPLTRWHRVLVRVQHSPGLGLETFIWSYPWVKGKGFKLMIPKYCWDLILKTDSFKENVLRNRDQIIKDGVPLAFTHFDPKLNQIYNHPGKTERRLGSVLVSCNWRIAATKKNTNRLIEVIHGLAKNFEITANLHPNTLEPPQKTEQTGAVFLAALKHAGVTKIGTQDSTEDMIRLYDRHEFILTDGSGTAYEAIARGCKALTLDGLSYQANRDVFHCTVELGLLPKTLAWEHKKHPGSQAEMEWLKTLYPTSLVKEDVTPFVAQEIVDVFNHWR